MLSLKSRWALKDALLIVSFEEASLSAKRYKILICAVNALVDATPTSWPHLVKIPQFVSLDTELPGTLQRPTVIAPCSLAYFIAARVSAVSPDCEIAITTLLLSTKVLLYLNSEAYSTWTGIFANLSIKFLPISPACHEVPQAVINILSACLIWAQ